MQTTKPSVKFNCPKVKGMALQPSIIRMAKCCIRPTTEGWNPSWNFLKRTLKERSCETIDTIKAKNRNSSGDLSIEDDQEPTAYLTAPSQRMVVPDNFDTMQLADFSQQGERIQHGPFVQYHPNGQMKVKGSYEHGKLVGTLESWHPNGQLASSVTTKMESKMASGSGGMKTACEKPWQPTARDATKMSWPGTNKGKRINNIKTTPDIGIDATREYPVSTPTKTETFR